MRRLCFLFILFTTVLCRVPANAKIDKDYFYFMSHNYLVDSHYEDAIRMLNPIIRADPDAYEAYYMRGIAKFNLDDLFGAEHDFSSAIEKNPVYTMAFYNRAVTRIRLNKLDDAFMDFTDVIALRPDLPGPFFSRGVIYFQQQRYEDAIADFNEVVRRDNKIVDVYINRGTSYLFLQDTVRALADYDQAIRTNMYDHRAYNRRGDLYMLLKEYDKAMSDFNKAIEYDSTYTRAYFSRAMLYANTQRPLEAIDDFSKVLDLEPNNAMTYFNRAITRSMIGDYNNALADYDEVVRHVPGNILVYYNRASVKSRLGDLEGAVSDYSKAIELYPDFANAYFNRSSVLAVLGDSRGARQDRIAAAGKASELRSRHDDSTFAIYADTSRVFSELLAFDSKLGSTGSAGGDDTKISMLPLFRFTFVRKPVSVADGSVIRRPYYFEAAEEFMSKLDNPHLTLTYKDTDIPSDSVLLMDNSFADRLRETKSDVNAMFKYGITQGIVKQYTNAVNTYTDAIEKEPANPFLYLNRAAIRGEMIDFVSSISLSQQRISVGDNDPVGLVDATPKRNFDYDEAISDLNKAAKLLPDFAHIYYNRANLQAVSGRLQEAYDDYTKAIELYPDFAEAYYNRGLVQIYMKEVQKGSLDVSKAGELGIKEAYVVLRRYGQED